MFITAARFPLEHYRQDQEIRKRAEAVRSYLQELALDNGFDPQENVSADSSDNEYRIGVSEEFDSYLREATGTWRHV